MTMATRCVACGTIFRVVQDQLKVSEGWVRCGRCDEVFNALEGLFDLERESPPRWQPGQSISESRRPGFEKTAAELDEEDRIASRFFRPEREDATTIPADTRNPLRDDNGEDTGFADAQFNPDVLSEEESGIPASRDPAASAAAVKLGAPRFVRSADRAAFWSTPRVRLWLSAAALALLLAFTLQAGHHFRDTIAAQWPKTRPLLIAWCDIAHCSIEAPRRIEDITVESSALTRAAPGTDTFKLSVTLRNRGALPVRLPSVDLTLTDAAGQLVARRALTPADFQSPGKALAPGSEAPLQLLLTAGTSRVAGYTVEVFYP